MTLENYSHLIFDFDGTLAKLHVDWTEWHDGVRAIAQKFDSAFDHPQKFEHHEIPELIEQFGPSFRDEVWAFNEDYETRKLTGSTPIPHALDALKNLRHDQTAYLLTSNALKTVSPILDELKITDLFQKIITRDDVAFAKPHPQPFELIAPANANKAEWVMIGDSSADSGFAENVGIAFIHVDQL